MMMCKCVGFSRGAARIYEQSQCSRDLMMLSSGGNGLGKCVPRMQMAHNEFGVRIDTYRESEASAQKRKYAKAFKLSVTCIMCHCVYT